MIFLCKSIRLFINHPASFIHFLQLKFLKQALRTGVLKTLLITLASVDRPMPLRKKCMYAVSTLVRHFPLAQIFFAQYGGFQIMLHLFNQVS